MNRFFTLDIRGPWGSVRRGRRQAAPDCPTSVLAACQLAGGTMTANAACPCGCLSQPY